MSEALILHQLTHNMTTDVHWITSSIHKNSKLQLGKNMLCTEIVSDIQNNLCTQHVLPMFELGIFRYWTCNSMNNLSSYCGLVDAKMRASDKDLPVPNPLRFTYQNLKSYKSHYLNCDNSGTLHWNTSTITFHAVVCSLWSGVLLFI